MSETGRQKSISGKDIHVFQRKDSYLGIHGSSMKVFELDAPSYFFLKAIEAGNEVDMAKAKIEVDFGASKAAEIAEGFYPFLEELNSDLPANSGENKKQKFMVENLMFLAAEECNMACTYCFAHQGTYGRKPAFMSLETALKAIDLFVDEGYISSYCILCFFGGEPLLNFDLIEKICEYAREKIRKKNHISLGFSLTTNATLLNEHNIDYMLANDFGIMISIDGPPEIHNLYRKTRNNKETYEVIITNIHQLMKKFKSSSSKSHLVGRPTLTAREPDIFKLVKFLEEIGFENIIVDPVSSPPQSKEPFSIGEEHVEIYVNGIQKLSEAMLESILARKGCSYSPIAWTLNVINNRMAKFQSCNAGVSYCAVDTYGDIYPCQRWVGLPDHVIGNVWSGIDGKRLRDLAPPLVDYRQPCSACWARYFCGGGCPGESIQYLGSLNAVIGWRCAMYKGLIESCVWLYSVLQQKDPEALNYLIDSLKPWNPAITD